MTQDKLYTRNKVVGMYALALIWALLIIALVLLNVFIKSLADILNIDQSGLRLSINLVLILILVISSVYYVLSWKAFSVRVSSDVLEVNSIFSHRQLALKNVSSVEFSQNFVGKLYNYGTVRVEFSTLESPITITLMSSPRTLTEAIKRQAIESSKRIKIV